MLSSTYKTKIHELLNLRQGEAHTVRLLMLYSFFQSMALALFFTAASALFLTHYPIGHLPYVYIAACWLLLLLYTSYGKLEKYFPGRVFMLLDVAVLFVSILLFRLGYSFVEVGWLSFGLIIWHRVMSVYLSSGFGKLVLLLFDVRQSKRLLGLVSSMEVPASVLGYLLASMLVPRIGTENLLWVSATGLLLALGFLALLIKDGKLTAAAEQQKAPVPAPAPVQEKHVPSFFQNGFIYALSITCFLAVITFTLIEFSFLSQVDERFKDEARIAYFLGIFLGIGQLAAFFIKSFFYGYLLRRFGIRWALFVLPLVLGAIVLFGVLSTTFSNENLLLVWFWVVIMMTSDTLKSALYNNTFLSLLQPLQHKLKLAGYEVLGIVEAIAFGVSGLLLLGLLMFNALSLLFFSVFLLLVIVAWARSISHLNKSYVHTLELALKKRMLEGSSLQLNDPQTLELLNAKLNSDYAGEVLYALEILCKSTGNKVPELLQQLLQHPEPEVRREVLRRIEQLRLLSLQESVRARIEEEEIKVIKKQAIRVYCYLGEASVVEEVSPYLESEEELVQTGALVGLICFGGINGIILAGQRLNEYVHSPDPNKRAFAADVIGEVGIHHFYHPLLKLLDDEKVQVRKAALKAAGLIGHARLFAPMLKAVSSPQVFESAINALIQAGEQVISLFESEFDSPDYNPVRLRRLVHICGKVNGSKSINLLKSKLYFKNIEVRNQVLHSLSLCHYKPYAEEREEVIKTIHAELRDAAWFLNCIEVIGNTAGKVDSVYYAHLLRALQVEMHHLKKRLLLLVSFIYHSSDVFHIWSSLKTGSKEKRANAIEILDVMVSKELSAVILPLLEDFPLHQQVKILNARYPQKKLSINAYLQKLINRQEVPVVNIWTQAISLYVVKQLQLNSLASEVILAVSHPNKLVAETALWTLQAFYPENYSNYISMLHSEDYNYLGGILPNKTIKIMKTQLLAIEKVMALKTTRIFSETSEDILVDIASILQEVPVAAGEIVVEKGEMGTCMYIIYEGSVTVHDGEHTLAELKTRDFFGELSLLDTEPRSASVTAQEESLLLRLDQLAFYEIMADRVEVTREIMKILCRRLRAQNQKVADLKAQNSNLILGKEL